MEENTLASKANPNRKSQAEVAKNMDLGFFVFILFHFETKSHCVVEAGPENVSNVFSKSSRNKTTQRGRGQRERTMERRERQWVEH